MNAREFEQRFLEFIFQTNLKLTPHVIAYRFGIPFLEAKDHLERLAKNGVVEMEIDNAGHLRYEVPGVLRPVAKASNSSSKEKKKSTQTGNYRVGQWFAGPASSPPPRPVILSAPPRQSSLHWLWFPLVLLGTLFAFPVVFTLFFLFFQDLLGLLCFFFMGFFLMKLLGGSGRRIRCRRSMYSNQTHPYRRQL